MGVKVKSVKMCFYHGKRFRPGEVFELPEGVKPSADMTVVEEKSVPQPKAQKVKASGPSTFSEIAKVDGKASVPKGGEDLV